MRIKIILCGLILTNLTYAQGCIVGGQASQPRYVCFDGRTLDLTETGLYGMPSEDVLSAQYPAVTTMPLIMPITQIRPK